MMDSMEMPRYKCHKEVHAFKISKIERSDENDPNVDTDGGATLTPDDIAYSPFYVSHEYMRKHKPQVGGYYIVYKDGYLSFSPAEAFEAGYSLI